MSELKVEVVKIATVEDHPNADRLSVITLKDMAYKVISLKGNFKVEDEAFYFPIDSVIPDKYVNSFGIGTYYSKRLKATKLRGIFSEGLLIPTVKEDKPTYTKRLGEEWTDFFGVTKYEPPIPAKMSGDIESPIGQYRFPSPENIKKYPNLLEPGETVLITEKIHGTNFTVLVDDEGLVHIGSHNYFWKNNLTNKNLFYTRVYNQNTCLHNLSYNTQVFGEIYGGGVQDINYGLNNGKVGFALFAVKIKGEFLDTSDFIEYCNGLFLPTVPLLYVGPYSWDLVEHYNDKDSTLDSKSMMEGIVVQPFKERTHPEIGRVVLKKISDRYLLRKNGTELH